MKFTRLATFAATFVVASAALAALTPPNPSIGDLSGSFRLGLAQRQLDSAQQSALDAADGAMGAEYSKFSTALKKASGAVAKLDKAFGDDAEYAQQADFFRDLVNTATGTQLGLAAGYSLTDDILRDPLRFAKLAQKNTKVLDTINLANPSSKISKAKNRSKQFKVMAAAAKKFEQTIKKYGKNNQDL